MVMRHEVIPLFVRMEITISSVHTHNVFFFQAGDGIRGLYVTGVQTCALPILVDYLQLLQGTGKNSNDNRVQEISEISRSEERRVGKECRSWWLPMQKKKNGNVECSHYFLGQYANVLQ